MRNRVFSLLLLLVSLLTSMYLFAQGNDTVKGTMRSNGKIYVVLAVCVTILVGLLLYLVRIDRKIGRIEDKE